MRALVGGKLAGVVNHPVRRSKVAQLFAARADQQVVHEQRMIRPRADHPHLGTIRLIPAGKPIHDIQPLARVEIVLGPFQVDLKRVLIDRNVDVAPPNVIFRFRVLDDPLVLGAAARFVPRIGDQRARVGDIAVVVFANGLRIQGCRGQVPPNVFNRDAVDRHIKRAARRRFRIGHANHPSRQAA